MAVDYKIWNFPKMAIQSQLFHVPGSYFDGGFTSGGVKIMSPEPGGRSVLEINLSLQIKEWDGPLSSWLMSKINGEIFKIPLVKTPQLIKLNSEIYNQPWDNDQFWDNNQPWDDDGLYLQTSKSALEGEVSINVDTGTFGKIIRHGHVLGFGNSSYIVDDIEYTGADAKISRPFFLGVISNGSEIKNSYEASNVGAIQLNRIIFQEVIL